jgi:hypothetical protein
LSIRKRVYLEDDLMDWFKTHRFTADMAQKAKQERSKADDNPPLSLVEDVA